MEFLIGFYVICMLISLLAVRGDEFGGMVGGIIISSVPILNVVSCQIALCDGDFLFLSRTELIKRCSGILEKFGYQGLDDESTQQLKDAKEARNLAVEAAKTEYATLAIGIKKKAKKRSILDKLELTEKDLDELKEILSERQ